MLIQTQHPTIIPLFIRNAFSHCYPNPQHVLNIYHQFLTGRFVFHFYDRDENIKETTLDAKGNWLKTVTELEDFQLQEQVLAYLHQRFKRFDIVELYQIDTPTDIHIKVNVGTQNHYYNLLFNENGVLLGEEKSIVDDGLADRHTVFDFENDGNDFKYYLHN